MMVVFLKLLVIIRAVELAVGSLSQLIKGQPFFSTCFLSLRWMRRLSLATA